ncbi:MAG: hypothetical protein LBG43_05755 [Treponema sp.]|jgi:hypothetical protein|nr:hypothetical protein [Treponema sp.]
MAVLRTGFDLPYKKLDAVGLRRYADETPKQDGGTALLKALPDAVELAKDYFKKINKAHAQFCNIMAKGAELSFQIGKALSEIKKDFVRDNFEFSLRTADSHIRMYKRFKDDPESIRGKTIADLNGGKERVKQEYNITEGGRSGSNGAPSWDSVFSMPTISGAPLKNYRFEQDRTSLLMYDRKTQRYAPALNLVSLEEWRGLEKARAE